MWQLKKQVLAAIADNDIGALRALVDAGYDDDAAEHDGGDFAIHVAARCGRAGMCALLLQSGSPVDTEGQDGDTPVLAAVYAGDLATVRVFLDAGAELYLQDTGVGPLHVAAVQGYRDIAAALIEAGADLQAVDGSGESPLHHAARCGRDEMCALLIEAGADANASDAELETPLHAAAKAGYPSTCALLIQNGADVSAVSRFNDLPRAGSRCDDSLLEIKCLLDKMRSCSPHYVMRGATAKYLTPFQHAFARGDVNFVRQVLVDEPNVDLAMKTLDGRGLIDLVGQSGELRSLLLSTMTDRDVQATLGHVVEAGSGNDSPRRRQSSPSPI
jgi:hypothetical protein